jgi:hypothetical protein
MLSKLSVMAMVGCMLMVLGFSYDYQTPSPTPTLTPTAMPDLGVGFLVEVTGTVQLKRIEWKGYYTISWGTALKRNDVIKSTSGTKAQVLCDDLTLHNVRATSGRNIGDYCPAPKEGSAFTSDGITVARSRAIIEPDIPYIISPRNGKLLTTTPTLHWHAIPNVTTYTVEVVGEMSGTIWSTQTVTNELIYQGATLQPGEQYRLIVTTNTGRSSEEDQNTSPFTIISKELATEVLTKTKQIQSQPLSNSIKGLVLSQLYANYELRAEAIDLLESQVKSGTTQEMVFYTLGAFYHQSKLLLHAEPDYFKAIELAKITGAIETQADAHGGLGYVYNTYLTLDPAYKDKAIDQFELAKALYEKLGDTAKVTEIDEQLAALK